MQSICIGMEKDIASGEVHTWSDNFEENFYRRIKFEKYLKGVKCNQHTQRISVK